MRWTYFLKRKIINNIRKNYKKLTIIFITHRLNALKNVKKIAKLFLLIFNNYNFSFYYWIVKNSINKFFDKKIL